VIGILAVDQNAERIALRAFADDDSGVIFQFWTALFPQGGELYPPARP
jgi:hypothetical protein